MYVYVLVSKLCDKPTHSARVAPRTCHVYMHAHVNLFTQIFVCMCIQMFMRVKCVINPTIVPVLPNKSVMHICRCT